MATKIQGLDDLLKTFQTLPNQIEQKILGVALREGAKVLIQELRSGIDGLELSARGKRKLKRGLKVKAFKNRAGRPVAVGVRMYRRTGATETTKSGREKSADPYWYHWIDQGTKERERGLTRELDLHTSQVSRAAVWDPRGQKYRRTSTHQRTTWRLVTTRTARTGKIKAQPFIEGALERGQDAAMKRIQEVVAERIEKELGR